VTVYSIVYYDGGVAGYCLHKTYKTLADAEKELEVVQDLIDNGEFGVDVKSADVLEIDCDSAE
jgi:hypothetical protein